MTDTMQHTPPPVVLTIAGSDSSGGAGIQADIKTISALNGYAASVITAVTAQNTDGVQLVYPLPPQVISAQIRSVMDDLQPQAVKIGMIPDAESAHTVVRTLQEYRSVPVVYDPVMVSTSGRRLMAEETVQVVEEWLLPMCRLVTPNLHETSMLWQAEEVTDMESMQRAARELNRTYRTAFLVKGGHLEGEVMCDILCEEGRIRRFTGQKVESRNLHGTGCTLSSAIAVMLAQGASMDEAVKGAKAFIHQAIQAGKDLHIGHGNGPLWHFFKRETSI